LTKVATSSDYGAPTAPTTRTRSELPEERPSFDRTLEATAAAAAPVDDARMIGLLLALVLLAVGGGTLAVRSRRL
jgi:hypothetical protein